MESYRPAVSFHPNNDPELLRRKTKYKRVRKQFLVSILLVGICFVVTLSVIVLKEEIFGDSNIGSSVEDEQIVTAAPSLSLTNFPTVYVTQRPTRSPTPFPTTATPTIFVEATPAPTLIPTMSPTFAPVDACESPDAICGCNLVVSELIDVVFVLDESGSVGPDNYVLMVDAVKDFVSTVYPPLHPLNGTRVGYVEFSHVINEVIELNETVSSAGLIAQLDTFAYAGGGTDHRLSLQRVQEMLRKPENAARPGSQLAIVMLTDGNPCVNCNNFCCANSFEIGRGAAELRALRDEFNFTFYFMPINPTQGDPISLTNFDDALGPIGSSIGLAEDELIKFDPQDFTQLSEFLTGDTFTFPLGPCVIPPTVSGGDYRLLDTDVEHELGTSFLI